MADIQENILLYSETVINTVCRRIQVSEQEICVHVTFSKIKMVSQYGIVDIS